MKALHGIGHDGSFGRRRILRRRASAGGRRGFVEPLYRGIWRGLLRPVALSRIHGANYWLRLNRVIRGRQPERLLRSWPTNRRAAGWMTASYPSAITRWAVAADATLSDWLISLARHGAAGPLRPIVQSSECLKAVILSTTGALAFRRPIQRDN